MVVDSGQEDGVLPIAGVVVTGDLLVHLQVKGNVHDHVLYGLHGHAVLLAARHIDTLQGDEE